jgi:hypothetical protein
MLMTMRAMSTVAQVLGGHLLLDKLKGRCQTKSTPCKSRGSEVATPPLDLSCTALVT